MTTQRLSQAEHSISGNNMNLGDLRWLVQQCKDLSDKSNVRVQEGKMITSTDFTHDKISVKGGESRDNDTPHT